MPPVRWKVLILVCSIYLTNKFNTSEAQLQDAISMSSDGWRPIVGQPSFHPEATRYQKPSQKSEVSTTTSVPSSPKPTEKPQHLSAQNKPNVLIQKPSTKPKNPSKQNNNLSFKKHGTKVARPGQGQYFGHGPHIPLGGAIQFSRPVHFKKHVNKQHMQNAGNKRIVKPVRNQATAQSNRNEVFVAPPNTGSYSFISHGPINNIKTRDTQELGLLGGNHFLSHPLQQNVNRFAIPSGEQIFHQFGNSPAVQGFLYTKPPNANEVHFPFHQNQNDDYTRNLVPPPLYKKNKNKENLLAVSEQTPHAHQFIKPTLPENVAVQVPPPFEQSFALNSPNVEISKAKLKVFHNRIPPNYNPNSPDYSTDYDFHNVKTPNDFQNHKPQQYEVTEGKHTWQDVQPPTFTNFRQPQRVNKKPVKTVIQPQPQVELNFPQFLPTPYRPDKVIPTSPTQNEASTVFTQVSSKMNKYRDQQLTTNPFFFDVKEVSTHYPILGKPEATPVPETEEIISNEITTNKVRDPQRTRLNQRRRRPTRPTTTSTTEEPPVPVTDSYDAQKTAEETEKETERPQRRRPSRYRTSTEKGEVEETFNRNRYRSRGSSQRKRVKPTETSTSEKITDTIINESITDVPVVKFIETTPPNEEYQSDEEVYTKKQKVKYELPNGYYDSHRYDSYEDASSETETPKKPEIITTTKTAIDAAEAVLTTVLPTPENEVDFSQSSTIKPDATLATTTPTTTSTEGTTTKSNRIRGRPMKYESSNRPRFSVKDYRQRLNQYTSTTSTTESSRSTTDSNRLNRYSSRLRTRPTLGTTTAASEDNEEHTESIRSRFKPKDPRHRLTTTESPNEGIITEKNVKSINTRLRPFGKYRSTTDLPSTTTKVAIKTNLFAQRRRPPQLSLRTRINNKLNKTVSVDEKTTTLSPEEVSESTDDAVVTTVAFESEPNVQNEVTELPVETTVTDFMKNDAMLYSQRVSDLTSSFQNEYNTPGLFKSVSPTSRRIPNYFTLSTDEPKLPIEAFFPNLMDKEKDENITEE